MFGKRILEFAEHLEALPALLDASTEEPKVATD